jgi:hypothetical protein
MSDSEDEGFHKSKLELITVRASCPAVLRVSAKMGTVIFRSAVSVHHELSLYEYPK